MLNSQMETLEPPTADENAIRIDVTGSPHEESEQIVSQLHLTGSAASTQVKEQPVHTQQILAAAKPWSAHDTRLMVAAVIGIAIIVLLIVLAKMHPFLSLLLGSAFVGLASGVGLSNIIANFEMGVGSTLQEVGLLIALGAMLGKLLADSGGSDRIIDTLLSKASAAKIPWAMALVAIIIGLPMFFEIGLVLLLPVIVLVAQRSGLRLMRVAIPALAGLSALHGLIPPHPGPLIAIAAVHAKLGTTLALGLLVAVPTVIICGPLFSILAAKWVPVDAPAMAGGIDTTPRTGSADVKRPSGRGAGRGRGHRQDGPNGRWSLPTTGPWLIGKLRAPSGDVRPAGSIAVAWWRGLAVADLGAWLWGAFGDQVSW